MNWVKESKVYEKEVKSIKNHFPMRITKDGIDSIMWIPYDKVIEREEQLKQKGFNPIRQRKL